MTHFTKTFTHPDPEITEKLVLTIELKYPELRVKGSVYVLGDKRDIDGIIYSTVFKWVARLRTERQRPARQAEFEEHLRSLGFVGE